MKNYYKLDSGLRITPSAAQSQQIKFNKRLNGGVKCN